ncbi:hypothetical protein QQS21_009103 [Conoideocrella luteorostrata]|uniref:ATP-grasp domain-containing protein n=1 Tax=Conoideocrella luteorostrata TaxID=1105319 RepID=A0AAJ0FVC1_9HYPO|nr:hypothetical protein QQS21_009103 [Conoideocrella luteorostrata]
MFPEKAEMDLQQVVHSNFTGVSSFETDIDDKRVHLYCHWRLNEHMSPTDAPSAAVDIKSVPCSTLDLFFTPISFWLREKTLTSRSRASDRYTVNRHAADDAHSLSDNKSPIWPEASQTEAFRFVQDAIKKNVDGYGSCITAVKLLLPAVNGYVVRNDIVQRRFLTCQLAEKVIDFTTPGRHIQAFIYHREFVFQNALDTAIGAIHLKRLPGVDRGLVECAMNSLEADIKARLSFPWIVGKPLPRKRLALVDGKSYPDVSTAPLGIYRAAKALGVELVVLDYEGHWAQDPTAGQWRDEFIACDLTLGKDLPDRIVDSLSWSKGPIHSITTYSDKLLPATARAAEMMGLFTSPPEAMDICHDKRRTREFAPSACAQILSVKGVQDLQEQLASLISPLKYPLIVKPITGYSSEGVTKVLSEAELLDAVRRNEQTFPGIDNLIEPYISGPEVDANFILLDGELIWSEINDDFPSSAENFQKSSSKRSEISSSSTLPSQFSTPAPVPPSKSFAELSTIIPSILPESEIAQLRSSLTETLLRLGFKNGVFHLEARVQGSKMKYTMTNNGMELKPSQSETSKTADPSVFLIEINPRVPGHQETFAVEYTYGIDYFAMHMLAALSASAPALHTEDDIALKTIIRSLSHPLPEHCQYPTHIVFIPLDRGGTLVTVKPPPQQLMQYVSESLVFMQRGEVCKDPDKEGKWPFVAYFQVVAKLNGVEGRAQARTIGEMVRESFDYVME